MKKIYLLIISLSLVIAASAQSYFQVGLPGTDASAIIQNPAGNFVVAGHVFPTGFNADVLLYEIDSITGAVIRSKQFSSTTLDVPYSICNTPDGNYLITGYLSVSSSDNDLFVAKLDTGFNIIWYRQMGLSGTSNDYGNSVEVLDSGLYAVTGTVAIGGSAKPSIIYLNDSGNVVKEFHLNTNQFASPKYKAKYLNNGTFGFIHLTNDICIVDTSGAILKNDAANFGIYTTDILQNSNGDYAVLTYSDYGAPQGASTSLCVYDSSITNLLVSIKLSGASTDIEPKQVLMDNGNYIVTANAMNLSSGATDGVLFKINSSGNLIWAKKFTPAGVAGSYINSIVIASDGSYVIAGNEGVYPNTAFYVVKMDSSGNVCESADLIPNVSLPVKTIVTTHSINIGTTPVVSTTSPVVLDNPGVTIALCSGLTGITESPDYFTALYPNPANNSLHVETTFNGLSVVTIYSVEGKIVSVQKLNQIGEVDIHSLSSGMYTLRISDSTGNVLSQQKFVKN